MTDIPKDVMQKAREQCDLCGITPHSAMRVHAVHVAAYAILAERSAAKRRIEELEAGLKPFADCCDQIEDDEDDEEWAKFRLLIKDYRRARALLRDKESQ